jgi:hypothetical protein
MKKKGRGFSDLTKKVLADKPENPPTSLADFQDSSPVSKAEASTEAPENVQSTEKRQNVKTSKPQSVKTAERQIAKTSKRYDVTDIALENRLTIYLSEKSLQALEESWLKIRRMTKSKISKSVLIDRAVLLAAQELDRKGEKSDLVKAVKG